VRGAAAPDLQLPAAAGPRGLLQSISCHPTSLMLAAQVLLSMRAVTCADLRCAAGLICT
jgi:hypothetical protein